MEKPSFASNTQTLLVLFGLTFIVFAWLLLSLSLGSLFLKPLIIIGALFSAAIGIFIAGKFLRSAPLDLRIVFIASLLYALFIGSVSVPTIFSGRDQGSISEAAYRLAQNGQLAFSTDPVKSFFEIYGSGTALNFPGFAYTKAGDLITQFPIGYTAWLAGFIVLFGLKGLIVANALLLFLFLVTFYALLRHFAHPYFATIGWILAVFSFLPAWFAKFTLTENMAVFLFVSILFNLILYFREGKFIFYAGTLLAAGLFAFTRIEGFIFLAIVCGVLFLAPATRSIWRNYPWKSLIFPGFFFSLLLLRDLFMNLPFFKIIGKAFIRIFDGSGSGLPLNADTSAFSVGSILFIYGLLILFSLGFLGMFVFLKEKKYILLLPALIALPTFYYLFSPTITLDHPWMLRRYLFSLFPTLLFSAVIGIGLLFSKDRLLPLVRPQGKRLFFTSIIFLSLLLLQLPAWSKSIAFAENATLLEQVTRFSDQFTPRDLVLVDRFVTGDGFSMLTGPAQYLFHRNAVYFFNPENLKDLDASRFERVFLLVPQGDEAQYATVFGERLVFRKNIAFSFKQFEHLSLESAGSAIRFPKIINTETLDNLYQVLPLSL